MAGDDGRRRGRRFGAALLVLVLTLGVLVGDLAPGAVIARDRDGRGGRGGPTAQIVGGVPVPPGKYPFMVFIQIEIGGGQAIGCGGSLLNATHVLTAAHCTESTTGVRFPASAYTLVFGNVDRRRGFSCSTCIRGATNVAVHPGWNPETFANDAAVLTLDAAVPTSLAQPIQLVAADAGNETAGKPADVAGWGDTFSGANRGSNVLRETRVNLVSDEACAAVYLDFDAAAMMCAAAPGRDSCQGDSGGPMFEPLVQAQDVAVEKKRKRRPRPPKPVPAVPALQFGVVSFGSGCADPDFPGVYTQLSNPTINSFVRQSAGL